MIGSNQIKHFAFSRLKRQHRCSFRAIFCSLSSSNNSESVQSPQFKGLDHPSRQSDLYHRLQIGPIKKIYQYITPSVTSLAGGSPMDSTFPFEQITVQLKSSRSGDDHDHQYTLVNSKELKLNYHRGDGLPELKAWLLNHVQQLHHPPLEKLIDLCPTVGSTDALTKSLMLLKTDYVLFDQYAYGAAVNTCKVLGKKVAGVACDHSGMTPDSLTESVLALRNAGHEVNVVYLCPIGQNPMGFTMSLQRKEEIYRTCQELDLIIIEDDAYYYLSFELGAKEFAGTRNLPKSFLSMDVDGRVIRFDSVSKFLAPGVRIGWITTSREFIAKYILLQECSTQFPSGFSQSIFIGLVKHWSESQLHQHVQSIQKHYHDQCKVMIEAIEQHLPKEICQYTVPSGGMFVFLYFPNLPITSSELFQRLIKYGLICLSGDEFLVPPASLLLVEEKIARYQQHHPYDHGNSSNIHQLQEIHQKAVKDFEKRPCTLRLTYAASQPEQIRIGIQKLGQCIQDILKPKS